MRSVLRVNAARVLLSLVLFGFVVHDASAEQPSPVAPQDPAIPSEAQLAADAGNAFALKLYQQLAGQEAGNFCCSAHSVAAVCLLTTPGADDQFTREVLSALGYSSADGQSVDAAEILRGTRALESALAPPAGPQQVAKRQQLAQLETQWAALKLTIQATGGENYQLYQRERKLVDQINALRQQLDPYQLRFANALWCDGQFPLRPEFLAIVQQAGAAEAHNVDFRKQPDQQRERINAWVGERTNDRIPNLLGEGTIDALTRVVLTNAVYFQGDWAEPFKQSRTKPAPFTKVDGSTEQTPLMNQFIAAKFAELRPDGSINQLVQQDAPPGSQYEFVWEWPENPDGVKLLELPYKGNQVSMLLVLPGRPTGLADIEAQLSPEQLSRWLQAMQSQEVRIGLPRFTLRSSFELSPMLRQLGITVPFQPGGLAHLSDHPEARELAVGMVVHQTFVQVNEKGTEAAAATALIAPAAAAPQAPKPDPEFIADHPFLFLIRHNRTGAILFIGRVAQPQAE
ncbi:MAG: serpin family protein [Planctomycetaceae bacterium]